jgi:hypothetical protein
MSHCTGTTVGMVPPSMPMIQSEYYGPNRRGNGGLECDGLEQFLEGDINGGPVEERKSRSQNAIKEIIATRCRCVIADHCHKPDRCP